MASYTITSPDGGSYTIAGPDESTPTSSDSSSVQPSAPKDNSVLSPDFAKSELEDTGNQVSALVHAPVLGVLNAAKSVGALESGKGADQSAIDKEVTQMNAEQDARTQNNPEAKLYDFAGSAAVPGIGIDSALGGIAAKTAAMTGVGGIAARLGLSGAEGAAQGAAGAASEPHDGESAPQVAQNIKTGAETGGLVGGTLGLIKQGYNWFKQGKDYLSKAGAEQDVGKDLNDALGGPTSASSQALEQHVNNPNAKSMPTADVTQNRNIASIENAAVKGDDKNAFAQQRQSANESITNDLSNIKATDTAPVRPAADAEVGKTQSDINFKTQPEQEVKSTAIENAKTPVEAQADIGAAARDVSNTERQGIKDAYTAIAPDETVHAPVEGLQEDLDAIRDKNHQVIHGQDTDDGKPGNMLSEIDNRYSGENDTGTVPVKQMIQDKNNLGDYVNGQYNALKNNTMSYDEQQVVKQKIDVAKQMRDAIKDHISNLTDVPSGVDGKSVGEAFNEAEGRYKDYQQKFTENPEQFKTNDIGQEYNKSSSAFGDYDYRLQNRSAGGLAEEGKKLLPINSPDALDSNLKNIRNIPDADGLVKSNLLANIKEKGIDAVYTPEVKAVLENNGFKGVSDDIGNIQKTLKSQNYTIKQRNDYIDQIRGTMQSDLEKTFASKVLKSSNGDVGKLLQDKDYQQQALDLADKQNDGGATRRGLGQSVLDHIKENSVSTKANTLGAGDVTKTEFEKFYDGFTANKDFLQKTLDPKDYNALEEVNRGLAQNSFMERTNASANNKLNQVTVPEQANALVAKGLINKIAGVPIGAAATGVNIFKNVRSDNVNAVVKEAMSNPIYAYKLIQAAKNATKDPDGFSNTIKTLYNTIPAVAGEAASPKKVQPNNAVGNQANPDQQPSNGPLKINVPNIDKEVKDATKPQSNNSNFSLVSDADAAEYGPGKVGGNVPLTNRPAQANATTKKNNDFQIADASKATNMPEDFIRATERAETQGQSNPDTAKAGTSSALGRSQFTTNTWNEVAQKHGLPQVTDANEGTSSDPRTNSKYSRLATGYYGSDNLDKLRPFITGTLNREPTVGDVYGAHFVGASGFKTLMSADPNSDASKLVPQAAKNNKGMFYDKDGNPFSVKQWYYHMEDRLLGTNHPAQTNNKASMTQPYSGAEGEPDF